MDRKNRTVATSVKIPENLLRFIDADVENNGDFANRTDWIVSAIRSYENYRTELLYKKKHVFDKVEKKDGSERL